MAILFLLDILGCSFLCFASLEVFPLSSSFFLFTPLPKTITIVDIILAKVEASKAAGEIDFPADYSVDNALRSAWLMLQTTVDKDKNPVLSVCTKESIINSLFDMVIQGLSPVKKQCYFIAYGKTLILSRSYMGSIVVAKRYANVDTVIANVIYEKDEFDFEIEVETGKKKLLKHKQTFESLDGNIVGSYAIVTLKDGEKYLEIMTMKQIEAAWNQGQSKGGSPAHKNFSDEMAKKSVINRACKLFINTSSDAALFTENEPEKEDYAESSVRQEIADNSNKGLMLTMDSDVIDIPTELPIEISEEKAKISTPKQINEYPMPNQMTLDTAPEDPF